MAAWRRGVVLVRESGEGAGGPASTHSWETAALSSSWRKSSASGPNVGQSPSFELGKGRLAYIWYTWGPVTTQKWTDASPPAPLRRSNTPGPGAHARQPSPEDTP